MISYPFSVDGVNTRVIEAGEGDDVVMLIHGLGARADRWSHTLAALATNGFHAYSLDLPGHGFADKGTAFRYTVPDYAQFVWRFLEELACRQVSLVGTSLGGHIAGAIACDQPSATKALVLVGSLGLATLERDRMNGIVASIRDASQEAVERKLRGLMYRSEVVTQSWIREEFRVNTSAGAAESFAALAQYFEHGIEEDSVGDRLAAVSPRVPTLLIWGREDNYVPLDVGRRAHVRLPKARLVVLDDCGHAPYIEQAGLFNANLLTFLRGHDLSSAAALS